MPSGPGHLQVTITRGLGSMTSLRFGTLSNARVTVGGQTNTQGNFTITFPGGVTQTTFTVDRVTDGASTTVPLVVVDGCGDWSTFVGGGPSAF